MRLLSRASVALGLAAVLSAFIIANAIASVFPGISGTTLTGKTAKVTFQVKGGASITCANSAISGEILNTAEILITTWHFGTCTTIGLPINSLGDAKGVILIHVEFVLSFIPPCVGFKLLLVHLEVPSTKLLMLLEGGAYAMISPVNVKTTSFELTIKQSAGKQEIESCGKVKEVPLISTDSGEFVQTGLEAKEASLAFGAEEEMA